jgi:protoheme IX farnesyltransferase
MISSTYDKVKESTWRSKLTDYVQLTKFRLSFLVVFSSLIAYLYAGEEYTSWVKGILLVLGGFFVTGSANALNQLLEKNIDKLMDRTKNRPLPTGRMSVLEATLAAGLMGVLGLYILFLINPITSAIGAMALFLYAFVYTPMKQVNSFAVFLGAIPGALSPVLGWVAATGALTYPAWIFFIIQFVWQFPHFWAIAWVSDHDYAKANIHLLPSEKGKDKISTYWILLSTIILIPVSFIPSYMHLGGYFLITVTALADLVFLFQAYRLMRTGTDKSAYQLMFGSFLYLPLVQLALLIDKLF